MIRYHGAVRSALTIATLLLTARAAPGHDSWLVAQQDRAVPGQSVRVAFVTAETFAVSEHATSPERVAEWVVVGGEGRASVEDFAIDGMELAARVELKQPGQHVVALALRPRFIELEPEEFTAYLVSEGAQSALSLLRMRGLQDEPGRELYTKHGKTFIQVGEGSSDDTFLRPAGHAIEIVPLSDPSRWKVGDEAEVRVLFDGRPAPGLRISSGHEGLPPHTYVHHVTTDGNGVARLTVNRPGLWFLRTHLIRPINRPPGARNSTEPAPPEADWESFWASITFRVAEREAP